MAVSQQDIDNQAANEAAWQARRLARECDLDPQFRKAHLALLAKQAQYAEQKSAADGKKLTAAQQRARRLAVMTKKYDGGQMDDDFKLRFSYLTTFAQFAESNPKPPTPQEWAEFRALALDYANTSLEVYGSGGEAIGPSEAVQIWVFLNLNHLFPTEESVLCALQILRSEGVLRRAEPVAAPAAEPAVQTGPVNPYPPSTRSDSDFAKWEREQLKDAVKTELLPIFREGTLIAMKQLNIQTLEEPDVQKLQSECDRLLPMGYSADQVAAVCFSLFGHGQKRFDPTGDDALTSSEMKTKYGFQNSSTQYRRA